jgi:hypothetical protein
MAWLDKTVIYWIIKSLYVFSQLSNSNSTSSIHSFLSLSRIARTGPVRTFPDFVDHVPISWGSIAADAEDARHAPAISSDCSVMESMICYCGD